MKLARLHHKAQVGEPIWHVQLAVVAAILLQVSINHHLAVGPKYAVAVIEVFLLVALTVVKPGQHSERFRLRRLLAVLLIALVSIANVGSLVLVLHALLYGGQVSGRNLLSSGVAIYLTNIIIFGLWYWELDNVDDEQRDFLFPQMTATAEATKQPDWQPAFFDYLYVSITNGSAFSPTDTMPLTHRIKFLMTSQSLISLATIVLVTARAVNILS